MANFLTFVKGTEYTLNIYNRIFAEHPCIITSSATGKSYTDIVTTGVVYYYVNTDGESYTGDINYDLDTGDIYTGSEYTINSKLLDIIKIVFTPSAAWTAPAYYIQSGKNLTMGRQIYIVDSLGDILNTQQFYYLLGLGHQAEIENFNYSDTFIDFYLKQVLPASVEGKTYTI